jgi:hypothetical protein
MSNHTDDMQMARMPMVDVSADNADVANRTSRKGNEIIFCHDDGTSRLHFQISIVESFSGRT